MSTRHTIDLEHTLSAIGRRVFDEVWIGPARRYPTAVAVTPPVWLVVVCAALAVAFCVAALWWFYLLVRGPKRPYADLLMALGMSATFAVMAV